MINYREQRGSLKDSLQTSRAYNSLLDLFHDLKNNSIYSISPTVSEPDITISYYCYDDRVKQHLFMVKLNNNPMGFIFEMHCPKKLQ